MVATTHRIIKYSLSIIIVFIVIYTFYNNSQTPIKYIFNDITLNIPRENLRYSINYPKNDGTVLINYDFKPSSIRNKGELKEDEIRILLVHDKMSARNFFKLFDIKNPQLSNVQGLLRIDHVDMYYKSNKNFMTTMESNNLLSVASCYKRDCIHVFDYNDFFIRITYNKKHISEWERIYKETINKINLWGEL